MQVHIFDAISRDQKVLRATEDEYEVQYLSADEQSDDEFYSKKKASYKKNTDGEMVIHLFGMTVEGEPVRIDVTGFRPFFYVSLPDSCDMSSIEKKMRVSLKNEVDKIEFKLEHKQRLYGYSGNKTYRFVKITLPSLGMMYNVRKLFLDDKQMPKFRIGTHGTPLDVYESNIDPMLRFFHMRDIKPCGWIEVDGEELESDEGLRI